ncbi:hypothetical protein CEXT_376071 [Caerostris extrusa]|uniref:Uncharacterized protein n=1 Tax=Caerostris extrusa TaxID=172846 RepID=A0AAV4XH61_CAEEX|nr:hypothetical protein CEXT_376071 [Caerostris extrusa]
MSEVMDNDFFEKRQMVGNYAYFINQCLKVNVTEIPNREFIFAEYFKKENFCAESKLPKRLQIIWNRMIAYFQKGILSYFSMQLFFTLFMPLLKTTFFSHACNLASLKE